MNVLVGLEALKAGFGWDDEELHDAFLFDVQVRYALGYHQLGEGEFDVRTISNFRQASGGTPGKRQGENFLSRRLLSKSQTSK